MSFFRLLRNHTCITVDGEAAPARIKPRGEFHMMSRDDILFSMFDRSSFGLEIGPSYNPILPKAKGFNVETLDHVDQVGLIAKYRADPNVKISNIEPVNYVSDGRPMHEVIGKHDYYDFILASHVVEHTTDMISFLNASSKLLKHSGTLVLIVPDAMSCFDVLRPLSSTGQVLQAYIEKRQRHPPGVGFDHIAYITTRDGDSGWWLSDTRPLKFQNDLQDACKFFESLQTATDYHDLHRWQFTPNSFRLIVNDLYEIGYIDMKEVTFHAPDTGYEFYISLSRNGRGPNLSRIELAKEMLRDLKRLPDDA